MKMLVIGMDGAQRDTLKRGWTPYLESLVKKGTALTLKEDLISRGWAEIMTGQHGITTGALYERPMADGTHGWTEKFKLSDTPGLGYSVKPLWQVLNDRGFRVGIMNVPTTCPAPKVNGFFVSGGGGGGAVTQGISVEQCYPQNIKESLSATGYIVDERLPSLLVEKKLYEPHKFFLHLREVNEKRTESFIELAKSYKIDFGFVVYRASVVTAETLLLPELTRLQNERENDENAFSLAAQSFYRHFDEQIRILVEAFPESQILLVSDHAMATRCWSINSNAFLVELGLQQSSSSRRGVYDFVKSFKHWVPYFIRQKLKSNPKVRTAYDSMITFDPKTSQAFSMSFSQGAHGIYINDNIRFGGPVEEERIKALKDLIIKEFNNHPKSIEHGFKAYPKPVTNDECAPLFPDIVIELPDGYLTTNQYPEFVRKFGLSENPLDLREEQKGGHNCIKAHQPLAVNVNGNWLSRPNSEKQDLRLIYDHIISVFK